MSSNALLICRKAYQGIVDSGLNFVDTAGKLRLQLSDLRSRYPPAVVAIPIDLTNMPTSKWFLEGHVSCQPLHAYELQL